MIVVKITLGGRFELLTDNKELIVGDIAIGTFDGR